MGLDITFGLFCLAVLALVVLAAAAVALVLLLADRRQLDIFAARLSAEQRVEHATRNTLKAMRDAVHRSFVD